MTLESFQASKTDQEDLFDNYITQYVKSSVCLNFDTKNVIVTAIKILTL